MPPQKLAGSPPGSERLKAASLAPWGEIWTEEITEKCETLGTPLIVIRQFGQGKKNQSFGQAQRDSAPLKTGAKRRAAGGGGPLEFRP
jgi:hypothetical protein